MQNVIEVHNIIKTYNGLRAVDGVSFFVKKGEFFGLLGPNGAGKTTTIRMVYGFSPISEGSVHVFGMDIARDWRKIKSRIGVCQQENTLDPDLSVEQNLHIFAGYFSLSKKQAVQRTNELLEFFALSHKRHAKVMELSGGMARRLMMARSLINQPDLLILDEPTTGLDPQSRHQVWEKLWALKKGGLTVLITTHYMEEAARLCDRLVIVDHGKILIQGKPRELIAQYAGEHVVEVEDIDPGLREFVKVNAIEHDDLGRRMILYTKKRSDVTEILKDQFCSKCIFREATLEDVFLRLTGRELRE